MPTIRTTPEKPGEGSLHFERVTNIVMDHLFHAERHPERLEAVAAQLGCSTKVALAIAIADNITEEYNLVIRGD